MSDMVLDYTRRPITVDELERMLASGIVARDEPVELIDGELYVRPPETRRHRSTVNRLTRLFTARFNYRAVVQIQYSVVLERTSAPHPDVALLIEDPTCYASRDPGPPDILLAVEVGDSTRAFDRKVKLPLYARTGLREVWLVDVVDKVITIHRDPRNAWYATKQTFESGSTLACAAFPDDTFAFDEIVIPDES